MHRYLPKPLDYWATNFYASVNHKSCVNCGICVDICQVSAIKISEMLQSAVVNLDRCLGCGNCVKKCPSESITLYKKENEIVPPQTREELNDIMMENKKGKFGKLLLTGTLILDAIKNGQIDLLML